MNRAIPSSQSAPRLLDPLLLIVLAVATVISLRCIGDPSLGYPDADRILMDGVFIHDFLKDFAFFDIYDYTVKYYAQYPALSIGYRPPFLPFVEAIFNGIFGVNMWSSRLAVLAFWLMGLSVWYLLVARLFDRFTAFATCLLMATTLFLAKFAWYTMAELAVLSMALLTVYLFVRYVQTDHQRLLYATAIAFGLAAWTKQTAVFLGIWMVLYALAEGRLTTYLRRRETWLAFALLLVILIPLAAITLWLGDQNIAQSVGTGERAAVASRLSWKSLSAHFRNLIVFQMNMPMLILAAVGLVWAAIKRDRRTLPFALLIVSVYLFFTYLVGKNERYSIFWLPAFILFAVLALQYLAPYDRRGIMRGTALAALVAFQLYRVYDREPNRATGYDEAARYVLEHSSSPTVFFDGYNNGYFTYFMRALDPERSMYVIRGDKLLSSSSILKARISVHAQTVEDIKHILREYGIQYVVVEKNNYTDLEIHQLLRDYLAEGPYELVREIPMEVSNREPLFGQALQIYKSRKVPEFTADYIELPLPVVGQTLKVPVRSWAEKSTGMGH